PPPPCNALPGKCPTCRPGGPGGFGPAGGGGGSLGGGVGPSRTGAVSCGGFGSGGGGCSSCGLSDLPSDFSSGFSSDFISDFDFMGMPLWEVAEPYTTLWLQDQPMRFTTGRQQQIPVVLTFNQEDSRPDNTNIFNLGPDWNFNLLSYIEIFNNDGD